MAYSTVSRNELYYCRAVNAERVIANQRFAYKRSHVRYPALNMKCLKCHAH